MAEKDWISKYFAPLSPDGLKDDVAVLSTTGPSIVTQDAMVEGVHFLPEDPIDTIARKLVRVNVSDIIAKGALPAEAFLTLGWPHQRSEGELADFAKALGDELSTHACVLSGGDTVQTPGPMFLSLTLIGKCLGDGPVMRSGAKIDDDVWVTGKIGRAKLGFDAIKRGETEGVLADSYRLPAIPGSEIAKIIHKYATASMDISDGLLMDALALARASDVCLSLELDTVPFAGDPLSLEARLALATWGDDYQTLFTAPSDARSGMANCVKETENGVKLARIGTVKAGKGLKVTENGQTINLPETLGFEHG